MLMSTQDQCRYLSFPPWSERGPAPGTKHHVGTATLFTFRSITPLSLTYPQRPWQHNCALALHLLVPLVVLVGNHAGGSRSGVGKLRPGGQICSLPPIIVHFCWNAAATINYKWPMTDFTLQRQSLTAAWETTWPQKPKYLALTEKVFRRTYLKDWGWTQSSYLQCLQPHETEGLRNGQVG